MRKLLFRADGNKVIGAGHVMRCLSVADAAKTLGYHCSFVVSDASFMQTITQRGFDCHVLNSAFDKLDEEFEALKPVLEEARPDIIIIDSYFVTASYLQRMKRFAATVYIDDLAAFAYPADVLVNYNIYAEDMDYTRLYEEAGAALPKLLLGPDYIPLREEFRKLGMRAQEEKAADILVSAGGADPERIAIRLIKYLQGDRRLTAERTYHFVLGAFEPDADEIKAIAEKEPWLIPHENVMNMSSLMRQCDIAVSAAGSTLYELCACGIPTITYVLADNQKSGAEAFSKKGIMISVGDCRNNADFAADVCNMITKLCDNHALRRKMAEASYHAVSKNGARNIIAKMESHCISLSPSKSR